MKKEILDNIGKGNWCISYSNNPDELFFGTNEKEFSPRLYDVIYLDTQNKVKGFFFQRAQAQNEDLYKIFWQQMDCNRHEGPNYMKHKFDYNTGINYELKCGEIKGIYNLYNPYYPSNGIGLISSALVYYE